MTDDIRSWRARRRRSKQLLELYTEGEREALTAAVRDSRYPLLIELGEDKALEDKGCVIVSYGDPAARRSLNETTGVELMGLETQRLFEKKNQGVDKYTLTEKGKELGEELLILGLGRPADGRGGAPAGV